MAKSVTVINKDLANALRYHSLIQPPEAVELVKLSDDIDKILKRPANFLQSGPLLDDYYGKVIKFMSLLKQANQSSFGKRSNIPDEDQSVSDSSSVAAPPNLIDLALLTPPRSDGTSSAAAAAAPTLAPISPQVASLSPISTQLKKDLLTSIAIRDKNFHYDHSAKSVMIHGKKYEMSEVNDLYSKLRTPSKIKLSGLSPTQYELLDIIKGVVENDSEGLKLIGQLPGLAAFISTGSTHHSTRRKKQAATANSPIVPNSPLSASAKKRPAKLRHDFKKDYQQKSGKGVSGGKIHFKRWNTFVK
jgi:hypothetical protein